MKSVSIDVVKALDKRKQKEYRKDARLLFERFGIDYMRKTTPERVVELLGNSGLRVAYDGCHKLYLCDDSAAERILCVGYYEYGIDDVPSLYRGSCELRYIDIVLTGEDGSREYYTVIPQYE